MTDQGFPDTLATVIGALNAALPLAYVGDELPPATALEQRLPIVQVVDLPGGNRSMPWQAATGPLIDVVSLDFYVLERSREKSRDLAARVRGIIFSLPWNVDVGVTKVIEESGFSRIDDWNPRVKREHGEYTFHVGRRAA